VHSNAMYVHLIGLRFTLPTLCQTVWSNGKHGALAWRLSDRKALQWLLPTRAVGKSGVRPLLVPEQWRDPLRGGALFRVLGIDGRASRTRVSTSLYLGKLMSFAARAPGGDPSQQHHVCSAGQSDWQQGGGEGAALRYDRNRTTAAGTCPFSS